MPKAGTLYSAVFVLIAVLLMASDSLAFGQGDRGESARQSPEAANQAEALFQDALLLADTQKREAARLQLLEAMRLWEQMREPGKAAKAALQMGDRYKYTREYLDALDCYKQALEVKLLPGLIRANALSAIALVYAELYQSPLAVHYFKNAFDQARLVNDLPAQTFVLTSLAKLYYRQGEKAQALDCIERVRQLNKSRNADAEPALLCLLGQISQDEGSLENAKGLFEDALAIYRKTGNVEGQVRALCSISTIFLLSSQTPTALEQAEQATELADKQAKCGVSHADKVSARELRWPAWLSRARAERALGQIESARKSYFLAISHFEGIWWAVSIATESSAIAFREEAQAAYREFVDLLMEQGKFQEAYGYAEYAKARTILNWTAAKQATPPSEDKNQTSTLRQLSRDIARLRRQLFALGVSPERQAKLQKEIEDAEYKMQETQLQAELEHARERLIWLQPATAKQLQEKTAKDQMALAEFSLGENHSFVWLFTHGKIYFEILPARKEIEKVVRPYLDLLAATPNHLYLERDLTKLRERAEAIFSTLFGRLSTQIEPGQRLIIVPDGLLHYLPFESLIHNGRYLIEDHEISYNPSASMLSLWQDSGGRVESGTTMELFAVGDPDFNRVRQLLAARGFQLAPLPRTRDEVQYIASLFPPDRQKVLLGRESTEEAIKRGSLRRYRRLHFATHSLIDEKSPWRSGVVLTLGDEAEEDGFLEVSEIARLDLDSDLVVVSACQTGRGQLLSGEGIVGLSRAFLYAGTRSVVVSLWNVTDISTGQLMKNFYQNLTGGQSNVAALRRAKLQMLGSNKETRHPYYWSSFVMVGKP